MSSTDHQYDPLPDPRLEPLYAETVAEAHWTPADLRPALDLDEMIARSYERVMVNQHLRGQIARRAQARKSRRPRRVSLP